MATLLEDLKLPSNGLRIGANSGPDGSAALEVTSTTKGIRIPTMTTAQRNAIGAPVQGLIVYDTDLDMFVIRRNGSWEEMAGLTAQQQLTNKDLDGGTASNNNRITIPKNTAANLTALNRKQGTIVYDTTNNVFKGDDGASLIEFAAQVAATPLQAGVVSITAQSLGGLKTFEGGISSAEYVGTNPEPGGASPFVLTVAHKRVQTVNPASAIVIELPTTDVKAGEVWTINNRSGFYVRVRTSDGTKKDGITTGTISFMALQNAPTGTAHWIVVDAQSAWIDSGVVRIAASTSNPTKSSNISIDKLIYRRIGSTMISQVRYVQSGTAGAAAGSGSYQFRLPQEDSVDLEVSASLGGTASSSETWFGTGWGRSAATFYTFGAMIRGDITELDRIRLYAVSQASGTVAVADSATTPLTAANTFFIFNYEVPISTWNYLT